MLHKVSSFHWQPVGSETKLTMERKHRNAVGFYFLKNIQKQNKKKKTVRSQKVL